MAETAIIKIKIRTGNTEDWEVANPILLDGEFGFDTENRILFIGNGNDDYLTLTADNANKLASIGLLLSSFTTLQGFINTEATTRASADTAISATVTTLSGTVTTINSTVSSIADDLSQLSSDFNTWYGEVSTKGQIPVVSETQGRASLLLAGSDGQVLTADSTKDQGVDWKTIDKTSVGLGNVDNTSDADKPVSTAQASAIAAKEPAISAGTTSQYLRGDKSWQTLDKSAVGLGNVDNTSDANKPVSTAQATAIATKEPLITSGTSSQYFRGDKTWQTLDKSAVGLGNVDNTSDANKPISTAQAAAFTSANANRKSFLYYKRSGFWYNNSISALALTTFALTANNAQAYLSFLVIEETTVITDIAVEITVAGSAGSLCHFGIYQVTNPLSAYNSGPLVANTTTAVAASATGVKTLTLPTPVSLSPGVYLVAFSTDSTTAVTMRTIAAGSSYSVGGSGGASAIVAVGFVGTRASFAALPSNLSSFTAVNQINTTPPLVLWFKVQ